MEENKGHCKHGDFDLIKGCAQCIEKRAEAEVNSPENIRKRIEAVQPIGLAGAAELAGTEVTEVSLFPAMTETALALRPGEDLEAHGYYKQAVMLQKYAEDRVIATIEDGKLNNDDLAVISKLKKLMSSKRKQLLEHTKLQAEYTRTN